MSMPAAPKTIVLDATHRPIGRLASVVATYLRGKHLATYTPRQLPQVRVRVTNLGKVHLSARRGAQPVFRFSGYPGGLKKGVFSNAFARHPVVVFRNVVRRMLPDNRSRKRLLRFLTLEV